MKLACNLKLKAGTSHESIITEILNNLNLNHRRKNRASYLSGGERRRLSIALELVANPTIFFLDEPTSGLDEVTAGQCIRLLKNLAKQDRTIVCTIHQPSATMFALFDQIFVLAKGKCVYQGAPTALVPFLSRLNLPCPTHYSPSDYIIELCDTDDGNIIDMMAQQTINGKLVCAAVDTKDGMDDDSTSASTYVMRYAVTSMILEKPKSGSALLQKMKAFSRLMQNDHANSGLRQFFVLLNVMMVKIWRNKTVLIIQLFHHILCGAMIGEFLFSYSFSFLCLI